MDPLRPSKQKNLFRTVVLAVSLFLIPSSGSLFSEPLVEEMIASTAGFSESVATTELPDSLAAAEVPTEPTTYALIAGGLLLSLFIYRRKLGVNPEAKLSKSS